MYYGRFKAEGKLVPRKLDTDVFTAFRLPTMAGAYEGVSRWLLLSSQRPLGATPHALTNFVTGASLRGTTELGQLQRQGSGQIS